jgi:hypothetical protein
MSDRDRPSAVRVFGKSIYTLSAGWFVAVLWLWGAAIRQHVVRQGAPPPAYGVDTLIAGCVPAAILVWAGVMCGRWAGAAPSAAVHRREWWQAFWWSAVPNLLLLAAVWAMVQG